MGGDRGPALVSSGPDSVLKEEMHSKVDRYITHCTASVYKCLINIPMNPMLRPRTKMPFSAPISTNSSASSLQDEQLFE